MSGRLAPRNLTFDTPDIKLAGHFDGQPVHEVTLTGLDGSECRVFTWGAVIADLRIAMAGGGLQSVILGFDDFAPYPEHSPYFGAVVGRYANRISGGGFSLNGTRFDIATNEGAQTCLHGGPGGFSQRIWRIGALTADSVTLHLQSKDGDQGFPGRLDVTCKYSMCGTAGLRVEIDAVSTKATVVNISQHMYFNLNGTGDVCDHDLLINADQITAVDGCLIPTGQSLAVAGTGFDFRTSRVVYDPDNPLNLDHNFRLAPGSGPVAALASARSGLMMEVFSDKPGLQVYDGHKLCLTVPGRHGAIYGPRAGVCLEPQAFPDSPNRPDFPSATVSAGEFYQHDITYRFTQSAIANAAR